ncbi:DUF2591 family protein [Hydrogenophaga sp. PBL-H3]|uniref:DUF2591 family protein n=1 Tax=Hydrogenophaga sp. PBL-H3 TaxID=434010 RepID=UPI00132015F2|nr:DUF2591 family protein [Hydrogenophaga sp. PBL-H3]QHE78795.1 DUF2591 domain-containing protein [Hydrogenophaga sp. PBL-H3]QHE83220.1 DUF2591 domain-containing protein [Hydrogenophaga sp. PBL-H3]
MKTINSADATGVELDWLVEEALGGDHINPPRNYSSDLHLGGLVLQREKIEINYFNKRRTDGGTDSVCRASLQPTFTFQNYTSNMAAKITADGPDLLIAGMRCFVIFKQGQTVEVPCDLVTQ